MKKASLLEFELAIEMFVSSEKEQEELIELCKTEFEKEPRPAYFCAKYAERSRTPRHRKLRYV